MGAWFCLLKFGALCERYSLSVTYKPSLSLLQSSSEAAMKQPATLAQP